VLGLALLAAGVQPLWRWVDPQLAVAAAYGDGLRDPWGNAFLIDGAADPADHHALVSYSLGPNGVDDTPGADAHGVHALATGDDVPVVLDLVDSPRTDAYRLAWLPPLMLAAVLALALTWRQLRAPRGPPATEVARALLLAFPAWLLISAALLTVERAGLFAPSSWSPLLLVPPRVAIGASVLALCCCLAAAWRLRVPAVARREQSDEGGG
jgi:hypothetical protein